MAKLPSLKPFNLEEKQNGPNGTVTEATVSRWEHVILQNLRKEDKWAPYLSTTWNVKEDFKGFAGRDDAEKTSKAQAVDAMLAYITQYAPEALFRDIARRCNSLKEVWLVVREWAGVKVLGSKHQIYNQLRNSYVHGGELSPTNFFYQLRNAKEDCLLTKDGPIKFKNKAWNTEEELSPCLESDVVLDWMMAIGGQKLTDQVFRVFAKDLETNTLADLKVRILDNLQTLMAEAESTAMASRMMARASIGWVSSEKTQGGGRGKSIDRGRNSRGGRPRSSGGPGNSSFRSKSEASSPQCKLCQANGRRSNHNIGQCFFLDVKDRKAIVRATHQVLETGEGPEEEEFTSPDGTEEEQSSEEGETKPSMTSGKTVIKSNKSASKYYNPTLSCPNIPKVKKVNIYESQILAVLHNDQPAYVTIDGGAETSLILLSQANRLKLKIN